MKLKTAIIIPIKRISNSKSRLSTLLDNQERIKLTELLISDLIEKTRRIENSQSIIVCSEKITQLDKYKDIIILREGNSNGVNNAIRIADRFIDDGNDDEGGKGFSESLIIPIDLPLLSVSTLNEIIKYSRKFSKFVGIVPSKRFDGTNILLRKPCSIINTFYDNNSYYNHVKTAKEKGLKTEIFDFENLMLDIDTLDDITAAIEKYEKQRLKDILPESSEIKSISYLREKILDKTFENKKT
ncbi:MAG: 2-phospho-L-lactate guanylyltransferase [Thermoproteota archaeon]|nr:2-phospho-L-lactate guanylyltransferase [Thermoproteota archaeon]